MKLEKVNNDYLVKSNNGKHIGDFKLDVDGSYYFWLTKELYGHWNSHSLREIAILLDEVNKPFDSILDEYFIQVRKDFEERARREYRKLLNESGMFYEFYGHLTGEWNKDKFEWFGIYKEIENKQSEWEFGEKKLKTK